MKAVILAAGMGARLGNGLPKPLTKLKGLKTILDFQLERIMDVVGIHNIYLVVGYKKEIIMEKYPRMAFVYNHEYVRTQTSKSLLKAIEKIDDDILWMNGDVFFEEGLIDLLFKSGSSACLVDEKRCGDEEIKYSLCSAGNIYEISKQVKGAKGESLGVYYIKKRDLGIFKDELYKVDNSDYFEKAIENLTTRGFLCMKPVPVGTRFCQEIDFKADLAKVRKFLKNTKNDL